jgi:hypothetical protein
MHATLRCALASLATLLVAISAAAEVWQFEATYSLGGIANPAPVGTGVGLATVNGSGGGSHVSSLAVPGGLVSIQSTTTPTGTSPPYTKLIVSMTPGAGSFAGGSGTGILAGTLPVPGNVRVCLFASCGFAVDVPFTENGTRGVGIGGTVTAPTGLGSGVVSIVGATWDTATATVSSSQGPVTIMGFAHGPASLTSSTLATNGVLQLVTPAQVNFTLGATSLPLPAFASLQVRFLPEPGLFAGLSASALMVASLGWRRVHASRRRARRSGGT